VAHFLVTGGAGFIGSNLAERILDNGDHVVILDNFSSGKQSNLDFLNTHPNHAKAKIINGTIEDRDICKRACEGIDYVLHQAALGSVPKSVEQPILYHQNNLTGTLYMLEASREANVKVFVSASSSSIYGDTPELPKNEIMKPDPLSPYAVAKLTTEYYANLYTKLYGLKTISLRYFNVFGPRQNPDSLYAAVIPKFITAYLTGNVPVIHGDGGQTRDFIYIENVVRANLNACHAPEDAYGKAINVGCGARISINDLAFWIRDVIGATLDPTYTDSRVGDVRDSLASIDKAKKYLSYTELVEWKNGLEKTINWYKTNIDQILSAKSS